jgi:hypothetical protein
MEIEIIEKDNIPIAEIVTEEIVLKNYQDAVDIMANCRYQGSEKIILNEKNIIPDFFDLKTGVAGEILQKFSNYNCQMAIVGEFAKFHSKSLKDFIFESNKTGRIFFVASIEEARKKLADKNY